MRSRERRSDVEGRGLLRQRGFDDGKYGRVIGLRLGQEAADDLLGEARSAVAEHPDVVAAIVHATEAFEQLLAGARAEGRLRPDATMLDLRLLFAATRAARNVEPEHWPRMLVLMIDALDTDRGGA